MALEVHSRVAWQVLDGQVVLIDLERGAALGLNTTASFLWQRLAGRTTAELAIDLAGAFAVEPSQAGRDVEGFLELLRSRGLVQD